MNKNTPKLRFEEFSDEWQEKKLGDLSSFFKGNGISKGEIIEDGRTECIRYGELYTHYKEVIKEVQSKTDLNSESLFLSQNNDVIIPSSGETSIDIATASCVLKDDIALSGDINIIRSKQNGIFMSYYLSNKKRIDIARLAQGHSVVHLYSSQLKNLKVNIPSLPEQEKIADFLTTVDEKIEKLEVKKNLFEKYKKGVMQAIFSQKIRFKKPNGSNYPDWEEKKLGEVALIIKGEQLNKSELTVIGEYPAINGGTEPSGYTNSWNVKSETITISEGGNSCGYIGYMDQKFWSGGHCYFIQKIDQTVNKLFLYQVLKYNENFIKRLRVGSGLPNIQKNDLNKFELSIPCLEEQRKISSFLTSLDNKINLINKELEQAKLFKKSLLQQMFV